MKNQRKINIEESRCLDYIEDVLTLNISNWEIIKSENIYDEDTDCVFRSFTFNRGNEEYEICIAPYCEIKGCRIGIPSPLVIDIANCLIYLLNEEVIEEE